MTAREEQARLCREQLDRLNSRIRELAAALKAEEAPQERERLRARLTSLRSAAKDVRVQLDHYDPPQERRARKEQRQRINVDALGWDWFEYSGVCWSDLEGHTWQQVQQGDPEELQAGPEQLQAWLSQASRLLTGRQRLYIDAYYNRGLSLAAIGEEYGVHKSTASRVIRNGLTRMQTYVESRRLAQACDQGRAGFDWLSFLRQDRTLTPRQRELLLLALSKQPKNQTGLADKLELHQSTVCRTLQLAGQTLRALEAPRKPPVSRPVIRDWEEADRASLAVQTGMGLGFVYRYCSNGEKIGGLTRYQYELKRRRDAGQTASETAEELGIRTKTVRTVWSRLRRLERAGT